ncbi:hypothetical protein E4H12_15450 [Candidatus Thorarchaeota archaeon]|nr:MAG: hypothetical protein E4H12_15450 [Candidatus Thorarchaeota archaeon]
MGAEPNAKELWTVRLVIGIPMLIMLFYAFQILSQPRLISTVVQVYILFAVIVITTIVLILTSQVTIPWTNVEEKHTEYFIEELEEQEKVFVIPTTCPRCKTTIELDKVLWEDKQTPLCQECQADLKIKIIDK